MYQFSRSVYRELAPLVSTAAGDSAGSRRELLKACEATFHRLATDRRYFARPTRTLFTEVRKHFDLADQVRVHMIIERYVDCARGFLAKLPPDVVIGGEPRQCHASTRKGTPCRREPLPGREYCPSHKHLEETADAPTALSAA